MSKRKFFRRAASSGRLSARVVAIYAISAGLWIALSDLLISNLFHDPDIITEVSIHKGLLFVAVSTCLLYILVLRATRIIKQSESTLAAVVDSVPQAVFWKDTGGVYLGCNAAFARFAGLSSVQEIVGKTDRDLPLGGESTDLPRSDDKAVLEHLEPRRHIIERLSGDGTKDIWVDTSKVPLLDDKRRLIGVLGIFDDITDRKRVQEELERAYEFSKTLLDTIEGLIVVLDKEGRITRFNSACEKLTGWRAGEVIGHSFIDLLIPADERSHVTQSLSRMRGDSCVTHFETDWLVKSGGRRTISWANACLRNRHGGVEYIVATGIDITARIEAEKSARTSLREKEVLLRELYHRTKNNMQVICSLLELQTLYSNDPQLVQVLREMGERIRTMALVHQKLYQSGNLANINLSEYFSELANLLMKGYEMPGVPVDLKLDLQPVWVTIDCAIPCGIILNELLSNALKYAFVGRDNGEVKISLDQTEGKTITLVVSDNGVGFAPNFDSTTQARLGLTTVTHIARHQLRGKLNLESRTGVTCTLCFQEPPPQHER